MPDTSMSARERKTKERIRVLEIDHIECETCRTSIVERKIPPCHSPSLPGLAIWKPLPADHQSARGHFVYGFPLRMDKLERVSARMGDTRSLRFDLVQQAVLVSTRLEAMTQWKHALYFEYGKPDAQSEEEGMAEYNDFYKMRVVPLLAMGCTASKKLYHRRPTPEQMEVFEDYLGEARWFETPETKGKYPRRSFKGVIPACSYAL
ncbi:hypothetical protein CC1G_09261 [Coprinopsis cinerea okayama7|uniref:Uncharacterized protein n=1 Tax=Coprinopsis cinerea (strain Okayama-7 / 130 / ATCC MYA-4618 / FGSC 9003) TaxID=240176 RepID=A8N840_COPC7|nr:hypothetical protein CC1G_09261 [Coprinopsis cinerea okayama7\|eukprot:XP_001830996.2 hypothetical protein CC1G_09261 [Coprinopsis cinerea okayama7\